MAVACCRTTVPDAGSQQPRAKMFAMPPPASLRSSFAWTLTGNVVYAAGQWALLSLIAKLGSAEMLGEYALAVAITSPVAMLSHLNLRAVIATDIGGKHPFGDYVVVRLGATLLGLAGIALLAFVTAPTAQMILIILAVGAAQSAENVSDTFYGALQRQDRMDKIARSMMGRAILSAAALGIVLWFTRNIAYATFALAVARIVPLIVYDVRTGESLHRTSVTEQWTILRTALPLGAALMLITLNTNLPRYAIERSLGTSELGGFAAAASFLTTGNTVVNALGQSATPRLARFYAAGDRAGFRHLALRLAAIAAGLGAAGAAFALAAGVPLLRIVYRADFTRYAGLLTLIMIAAIPIYVAGMLGYLITSVRAFQAQLPLFCLVAATCFAASWMLVPRWGLIGGPAALGLAACVQAAGELAILSRAFRRPETAS